MNMLQFFQYTVDIELAVAETLEVPSSRVSVGSNRTDTETVDLFWSDASVSGSD